MAGGNGAASAKEPMQKETDAGTTAAELLRVVFFIKVCLLC